MEKPLIISADKAFEMAEYVQNNDIINVKTTISNLISNSAKRVKIY